MRTPSVRTLIAILSLLLLPFSDAFVFAGEEEVVPPQTGIVSQLDIPIEIFADEISHYKEKSRIVARGRVQIKYQDRILFADQVVLNTETGFGEARGHILYKDSKENITCERAQFNIEKKEGILFEAKALIGNEYRVEGKEFEHYAEDRYRAAEATVTTCDGPLPFWSLCAKELDGEQEGYMTMKDATVNIKGVPILYLPYWYASVASKRRSGFLMPEFQYSGNDGSTVKIPYFWAINPSQDVTFYLSYLSKKGFKPEADYRYVLDEKSHGQITGLYLNEKDTKRTFWSLGYNHTQEFENNLRIFGSGFMQDRSNAYTKEFSTSIEEQAIRTSRADVNLSKEWDDYAFLTQVNYEQSLQLNSEQSLKTFPNIRLLGYQQRLGETPFYVALDSSLNYIEERQGWDTNKSKRFDVRPSFIFQKSFFPWVNVSASASGLFSFYQQASQTNSNIARNNFLRKLYHLNVSLRGPALSKEYAGSFKHTIEPFVQYNFIPNLEKTDRRRIALYDEVDALSNMNKFTYGFNNSVIGYFEEDGEYVPRKVMNLLLQQSYRLDNAPGLSVSPFDNFSSDIQRNGVATFTVPETTQRKFSNIYGKLDLYFAKGYTVIADVEISPDKLVSDRYNISLKAEDDGNELILARRYNRAYNNYWSIELSQAVFDHWRVGYQNGYSETDSKILYHLGALHYTEQCWGVSLEYIRKSTIINNIFQDNNRVTVLINLRGLGSFGRQN